MVLKLSKLNQDKTKIIIGLVLSVLIGVVSELSISNQALMQKILWVGFAIIGLLCFFLQRNSMKYKRVFLSLCLAFAPFILAFMYTFVLNVGNDKFGVIFQSFTTVMFIVVDVLAAFAIISYFKQKSSDVLINGIIISYVFTIILAIKRLGIVNCILYIIGKAPYFSYYFERHDVGVAVIPFLLYFAYLFLTKQKKLEKPFIIKSIALLAIMILCGKRSAYIALVIGLITVFFVSLDMKYKKRIIISLLCLTFVSVFAYVFVIRSGILSSFVNALGINSMGRIQVYEWFNSQYTFSLDYFGKGFQYIHRYMVLGHGNTLVNDFDYLHNSILQLFIELGFLGFTTWFGFSLFGYPYILNKFFNKRVCLLYIVLIVATIAMFTVDNVLTYPLYILSMYVAIGEQMFKEVILEDEKLNVLK